MPRLEWNTAGSRFYEHGVDRGVLYVSGIAGVPWNGISSVSESPKGGDPQPYYFDGYKYLNISSKEEFEATIEAYSCPSQFLQCDGTATLQNGLYATQQRRKTFGFSYRSGIDNDTRTSTYKIHLIYNALSSPSNRKYTSQGSSNDPDTLSWSITTKAPVVSGIRPTAHFLVDTRYADLTKVATLEDILYGTEVADARLPDPSELISIFGS